LPRWQGSLWISLVAFTIIAVFVVFLRSQKSWPVVPDVSEIESMEATFYDAGSGSDVKFSVAAANWQPILSSLLPATRDSDPAKWVSLGELQIKLTGGRAYLISLYSVSDGPGAFSSGPSFEQRTYYRGGSIANVERALTLAFKAAHQEQSESPRLSP
jgi:hypothetical protein